MAFAAYSVKDLETSRKFYEEVMGFTPENIWVDEATKTGYIEYGFGPNNEFTLTIGTEREGMNAGLGGACVSIEVEDFDAAVKALKGAGTTFTVEPFPTSGCHMALFLDPSGNQLMVHKRNAN